MNDMAQTIIPKSDQINADDLISGPLTITIRDVQIAGGQEQPVSIFFDGSDKPYKSCKSMNRVLVAAWGPDSKKYTGRSLTLYRDPTVKWGGMEVGGIRISHMTDIDREMVMALTATKGSRKPFVVKPLAAPKPATEPFDVLSAGMDVEAALKAATDIGGLTAAWKANARKLADIKAADANAHAALVRLSQQLAGDFDKPADLDAVSDDPAQ